MKIIRRIGIGLVVAIVFGALFGVGQLIAHLIAWSSWFAWALIFALAAPFMALDKKGLYSWWIGAIRLLLVIAGAYLLVNISEIATLVIVGVLILYVVGALYDAV